MKYVVTGFAGRPWLRPLEDAEIAVYELLGLHKSLTAPGQLTTCRDREAGGDYQLSLVSCARNFDAEAPGIDRAFRAALDGRHFCR
jgi:hypothetical protein